jgi:hypothetical protein
LLRNAGILVYLRCVSSITISLPNSLAAEVQRRALAAGYQSKEDYLLEVVRAHCEQAELETVLESRLAGPFSPLEPNWKQRVRDASKRRG